MSRIHLGEYEIRDSSGLELEVDVYIPRVSNIPDISIEFRDELTPSTAKLAKDPNVMAGLITFLRAKGYDGPAPLRIVDNQGKSLLAEVDLDFITFAEGRGWLDLTENAEAGAKHSLISILDAEEQEPKLITKESENVFVADNRRYLVIGFNEMSTIVCSGIMENLQKIDTGILAGHSSSKLAEGYDERKELIEKQKEIASGREDFNEWMKQYLLSDSSFFTFVATSLPKDRLYDLAFGGQLAGKTENHAVFELSR